MKLTLSLPMTLEHDIYSNQMQNFDRIYLLLHGYMLDGKFIQNILGPYLPKEQLILAPNGPFMVPYQKDNNYYPRFAWYFYDPHKKSFYINYDKACYYIKSILAIVNPDKKPVTVIGYSQGGYLSPKLAEDIPEIDTVIGLACVFRNSKFTFNPKVTYHQIHGDLDLVVELKQALDEWAMLKDKGNTGQFIELQEVGHKLSPEYFHSLQELLS
jgi:predicted esterase